MPETRRDKNWLYQLVHAGLGDRHFIVVSNREPYVHTLSGDGVTWHRPVSGLTEALDPVMRACGGTWIAQGTGDADRQVVDDHDRVSVPPDDPRYILRRVWLTDAEVAGFYLGFSNETLWPLCHITFTPPIFREEDWTTYQKVNGIFADAVIREIGRRPALVLVQDYHLALLARYIKERNPDVTVGHFWHIPWPPYEVFRTCPWHGEIIDGLLGNDLLGFQTRSCCRNFADSAARSRNAGIDRGRTKVTHRDGTTRVESFPISVDFASISAQAGTDAVAQEMASLSEKYRLEDKLVGVGMDRMDYTKGILERLRALDKFFGDNPEYRGKVVFIQAGMSSRTEIDTYRDIASRIQDLIKDINIRYGDSDYRPVIMLNRQLTPDTMNALRRLSRFCVVSSLHDGMNLVAKEYVSARIDGDGVLVLSRFAGAAVEMQEALLIHPYDIGGFARAIKEAVEMPEVERRRRMKKLRATVASQDIYDWGAAMVSRLIEIAGT